MIEVVPAIIPEDLEHLRTELSLVRGEAPFIQIDISNGTFAPTVTWPFQDGGDFRTIISGAEALPFWKDFQFEVDMLIANPEEHLEDWIKAGASKIIVHLETTDKTKEISEKLKDARMELGISINPSTSNEKLYKNLEYADFVQFMGNNEIGFHGVELDEKVLKKISDLRQKEQEIIISVDIGVDEKTAPKLVQAGANKLVSGSAIFNAPDISKRIKEFQNLKQ